MNRFALPVLALTCLLLPSFSLAQTTIVVPVAKDNTLYETPTGSLSNGAGEYLFAGRTQQGPGVDRRRALIAFDLSTVPTGATVLSAELTLQMNMTIASTENVSVHRLLADWGEGASNATGNEGAGEPAAAGDATWIHTSFPSSTWSSAGGDYTPTASDVQPIGSNGAYIWSSTLMAADVQAWLDNPGSNFGWILIGDEGFSPTAKRFDSSQTVVGSPPQLSLVIAGGGAPIPAQGPIGLLCLALLLSLFGLKRLVGLRRSRPSD